MNELHKALASPKTNNALGLIYQSVAEIEEKEVKKAERAKRLHLLTNTDVWKLDVVPILRGLYDEYLDKVKTKQMDPDALKSLEDFVTQLDGAIQLGAGAMKRMAERRLRDVELKNKLDAQKGNPRPLDSF